MSTQPVQFSDHKQVTVSFTLWIRLEPVCCPRNSNESYRTRNLCYGCQGTLKADERDFDTHCRTDEGCHRSESFRRQSHFGRRYAIDLRLFPSEQANPMFICRCRELAEMRCPHLLLLNRLPSRQSRFVCQVAQTRVREQPANAGFTVGSSSCRHGPRSPRSPHAEKTGSFARRRTKGR